MNDLVKAYVSKADDNTIRIRMMDDSIVSDLAQLGFSLKNSTMELHLRVASVDEKAQLFARLRDLNVGFSDGKEWSPSEVFEQLRDANLIEGKFKKISWTSSMNYHVSEW